ncbi:MAG: type II toxin-antitoxin system HipA family toxin [Rhodoferax sp.]
MRLSIHVLGREVATLEQVGDFRSVVTYLPDVRDEDLVSLTMPVRSESYVWDDTLSPVLQMNLPEGYLLQVLQEEFGPHVGASPTALLSVIGRNMIGRLQVAPRGADLTAPPQPLDVAALLRGDNSEAAFARLVRAHATSGVSGVVPKFLDAGIDASPVAPHHPKATLVTRRHIIKGSSTRLPFAALNEHLCMQVARQLLPTARTDISDDGLALVVHRFDVDDDGQPHWALEDFCSLLGLRPAAKYDTTWERIARAVRDHVPGPARQGTFRLLATVLLLTCALRNADCHAKNLALRYTSRNDVHLSPVFDILTTSVYAGLQGNPPAIGFLGKKTWLPGKHLPRFLAGTLGIPVREQQELIQAIADAVDRTIPLVEQAMQQHPGFREIGRGMLAAWAAGVAGLREGR